MRVNNFSCGRTPPPPPKPPVPCPVPPPPPPAPPPPTPYPPPVPPPPAPPPPPTPYPPPVPPPPAPPPPPTTPYPPPAPPPVSPPPPPTPVPPSPPCPPPTVSQIHVTRELDGKNDTGVIGQLLTVGTDKVAEANKYFAMSQFVTGGLLSDNNQLVATDAVISNPPTDQGKVLCADDMYVAGDPKVGGKGNQYKDEDIKPNPGFYTMFQDGADTGEKITVNAHVETINAEGNTAFTEYGFMIQNPQGQKTQAVLSAGQLTIVDANGQSKKLLPPNDTYFVGDPMDPTAKFYYADAPGAGKNGKPEKRLMVDYYEKPSADTIAKLVAQGADPTEAAQLRSTTTLSYGFRVPDGVDTYASPEGVGAGTPMKVASNGVKTYYDSHYNEGQCSVLTVRVGCPPTPPSPPPPPTPPTPPPPPVAANEQARIWGDPHIDDADGGKYEFHQTGLFNVLKDTDLTVNARHIQAGNQNLTVVGEVGVRVGSRTINLTPDGQVNLGSVFPTFAAEPPLQSGQTRILGDGATISRTGNVVNLETPEYKVKFTLGQVFANTKHIDMDVWTKAGGVLSDGVAPTGLLGETFDADSVQQTAPKLSADAYRVSDLIDRTVVTPPAPPSSDTGSLFTWDPAGGQGDFIATLYGNLYQRAPQDVNEINQLIGRWDQNGLSSVLKQFYTSPEFQAKATTPEAQAEALYNGILQRPADANGKTFFANQLKTGAMTMSQLVDVFLTGSEYTSKVQNGKAPKPGSWLVTTQDRSAAASSAASPASNKVASTTANTPTTTTIPAPKPPDLAQTKPVRGARNSLFLQNLWSWISRSRR